MSQYLIKRKQYSTEPVYTTYEDLYQYSEIPRLNIFPYPFYFQGNPFSSNPFPYNREPGWSPELRYPNIENPPDFYPQHCFQAACNTTYTDERTDSDGGCCSSPCVKQDCIHRYR